MGHWIVPYGQDIPIYIWYESYPTHSGEGYEGRVSRVSPDSPYGAASLNLTNIRESDQGCGLIDDKPLKFRGEMYHPYHFNCTNCGVELDYTAREVRSRPGFAANDMNELYCLRCHDKMGIPICGACRRPIEERVVTALGKHWHVEHFVCAKCEKPFFGHRHYEKKGLAYCEVHYHQLFGNLCFVCNQVIAGDVFTALNKAWCVHHFACSVCDQKMNQKTKLYECDLKPVCKKCYEKFPTELRRRLKRQHEAQPLRKPQTPT
ncbi:hypothetical protein Zmor_015794 [Zophobas morio]|uniref:LIM zinc-binding domain-containing protein n=1 Tax=Zophobas morio TaxID=2755281 RepID=A0AA38IHM3_9CUCU|nr:hypothetical protein Zmor_015794 [Zophobas morio]